ncbi:MAG: ATP-binding cassette domain-containing protein, partial [Coriobacteriales bacterium]
MLLEADDIRKVFNTRDGEFVALDGLSLHVDEGERVGLIGESGSGKTTLANVLLGLELADGGSVEFEGNDLEVSAPRRKRSPGAKLALLDMQMVFQHPAATFSDRMHLIDGIAEGLVYHGEFSRDEALGRALEAMEEVGLP